jgi:hypothetical protein
VGNPVLLGSRSTITQNIMVIEGAILNKNPGELVIVVSCELPLQTALVGRVLQLFSLFLVSSEKYNS